MKKTFIAKILIIASVFTGIVGNVAFADQFNVITLGANLTSKQKEEMLKYFNAKEGTYQLITINNKEEREALKGIATENEIGNKTISCSYVQPTEKGNGINVKTVNLTWVTAAMITNTLVTAGVNDANVIAAAPFQVSGTGALTGILKGFEDSTGEKLDNKKKELANKELIVTGNLADNSSIGKEKAAAVVNDVKTEVIKDKAKDEQAVTKIINNITNNYNINLSPENKKELQDLMVNIGKQDYNYDELKKTLNEIGNNINEVLKESGEAIKNSGLFDKIWTSIKNFFNGSEQKNNNQNSGIINETNDSALSGNTVVTSNTEGTKTENNNSNENSQSSSNENNSNSGDKNIFDSFVSWIKGIFNIE